MSDNQQNNQNNQNNQTNHYNNSQDYNQEYYRQQSEQIRQLVGEVGKIAGSFAGNIVKTVSYSIGTSMNEVATQLQKEFEESKKNTKVQEEIWRAKEQARRAKQQARDEINKARHHVKETIHNVKDGYGYSYDYHYDYQYGCDTPHPRRFKNNVTKSEGLQGGLMVGFGGFFSFCFFISAMVTMFSGAWQVAIPLFVVMGLFGSFSDSGKSKLNRNKRYLKYMQYMQGRGMCEIEELALFMNKSEAYVRKDLIKMIKMGYFQSAYMDRKRTCIFLDKAAYDAYINGFEMQNPQAEVKEEKEPQADENTEFVQMLQEGRQFIGDMAKIRSGIVNEDISKKILKLEQTATKILQYIEDHPAKAAEIRKFMRYYLPTTIKLLSTYHEMESQNISGEIIENTMKEIDGVLTTIDSAFTTLLDNMFQQDAMDIAAEINVMNNMMTQEGLAGSDFAQAKPKKADNDEPKLTLDTGLDTTIAALDATGITGEQDGEIQLKL